jgi:hypothetical protein
MIQRIQTLFLLLASASFGSLFAIPFAISDVAAAGFLSDQVFEIRDHPVLLGLAVLGALLGLIAMFAYNNRKRQRRLVYGVVIMGILLPVAAFILFMGNAPNLYASAEVHDQFGLFVPAAAILFGALANHFIRKDEKLVQSMDRLR